MKKKIMCIAMALVMVLALTACGEEAVTEVGTYELTEFTTSTIEQGKLANVNHNTITIFSDNTFVLTTVMDVVYSSDGGETYSPSFYGSAVAYGTYEVVDTNEELGESTIKITSITRVVSGDYDTAVAGTDADKEAMANNEAVGVEIILGADHKMSTLIGWMNFYSINTPSSPGM